MLNYFRSHPKTLTKVVLCFGLAVLLVSEFNNCGTYGADDPTPATAAVACINATCITAVSTNLSVTAHLSDGEFDVPATMGDFNLGGDCNEGGFPANYVHWELSLNGIVVRNSAMTMSGGLTAESKCVNGRFLVYVNLAPITQDPVDRTGLSLGTGQGRAAYTVNLIIYGQGGPAGGTPSARTVVNLNAI